MLDIETNRLVHLPADRMAASQEVAGFKFHIGIQCAVERGELPRPHLPRWADNLKREHPNRGICQEPLNDPRRRPTVKEHRIIVNGDKDLSPGGLNAEIPPSAHPPVL